ncbi:MAG: phosphoribosylamine--glycine ligase [Treponema sp.]|jgi:phosphoribosylamine--glycine ligase|nr:phosphoribosylamine--glycine ligase [Treponema sp.]
MKFMVIGSGGREHAMIWKLGQSKNVGKIYAAPGNGGSSGEKKCENVDLFGRESAEEEIQEALIRYAIKESVDLTIVGPEAPLAAGIVDRFRAAGLNILGPDSRGAALEASKAYAKSFMEKYGVRAAKSLTFTGCGEALEAVRAHFNAPGGTKPPPLVIKADGLAAGKGVIISASEAAAKKAVRSFMEDGALGGAGKVLVLEEFLEGREVSVLAAVSAGPSVKKGGAIIPFVGARDHKRRFEGDEGPNTGGMGAVAPVPDFSAAAQNDFYEAILTPTLRGINAEGFDYRGFIFFGLMIHGSECKLLEYNVRLGDPETQALLPLMESDFALLCTAILDGSLERFPLAWKPGAVCAPVAVAGGYPGEYRKGDPIAFNETAFAKTGALFFAAGAARSPGGAAGSGLRTAGGRVFTVSAYGAGAAEAREKAYAALKAISFDGMACRRDIGAVFLKP